MSSSKPDHLNKMFVLEKSAEAISKYSEFRRVLWTGEHSQMVCMSVPVGGEIGEEIHTVDQVLTFTSGSCKAIVNGEEREVGAGDIVIVPAGCKHNFIVTSGTPLVLFTVYAPAEHNEKTVHKTKEEGDKLEEEGKDEPPAWAKK
ncbi:RmlC-like cupin [Cystobasidium minutum MCA 4210]|uniref:RmlC-like cupin n=1 Tax=Cystobasidium minutum MCA 4210 TaxID=1397322 RepID=UPI0034CF44E1|eukprot:jgi/Rhomi1/194061/gm1.2275_g